MMRFPVLLEDFHIRKGDRICIIPRAGYRAPTSAVDGEGVANNLSLLPFGRGVEPFQWIVVSVNAVAAAARAVMDCK